MALMTFVHFPEVELIKAGLLFVMHSTFIDERYKREDVDSLWALFEPDLKRLEIAFENAVWPAKAGGLCGWCPVSSCKFYREK
jgi:hypothetical protein